MTDQQKSEFPDDRLLNQIDPVIFVFQWSVILNQVPPISVAETIKSGTPWGEDVS